MTQLEYDRGDLLQYRDFMFGATWMYVIESSAMLDKHGLFLNCAVVSVYEARSPLIDHKLASGFNLFGSEYADLPDRCGWLNVVAADES